MNHGPTSRYPNSAKSEKRYPRLARIYAQVAQRLNSCQNDSDSQHQGQIFPKTVHSLFRGDAGERKGYALIVESALNASDLWSLTNEELLNRITTGHPIAAEDIENTVYRGVSLGLPSWIERLTWKKFRKAFFRDPSARVLRGWNIKLRQNGIHAEDIPVERKGKPLCFGHYEVVSTSGYTMPQKDGKPVYCHRGLLLDYGKGKNPPHLKALRDPIVAVNPGDSSLLLGWTYLDVGVAQVPTPSFFTLERRGPVEYVPET